MVQENCVKPKIVIITGATGVGKSAAAVEVAKRFNGEIIGADSMQIYKGFDIGTGKVTQAEMQGIRHRMIDIVEPDDEFSVGDYVERVKPEIDEIVSAGKLPVIVGGTVFYLNALLGGFNFATAPKDDLIREELKREAEERGDEYIYEKLKKIDPISASNISINDTKRLIRALEIYFITGKPKSEVASLSECPYDYDLIYLTDDRKVLYERIEKRVDGMVRDGLVEEAKGFYHLRDKQSMQAIGYKELVEYFDSAITLDEAIAKIKINSRHYAKRQLTFIRSLKFEKTEIDCKDYDTLYQNITEFLKVQK